MLSFYLKALEPGARAYFVANGINTVETTSASLTSYYDFDTNTFGAGMGAATAEILGDGWVRVSRIFTNNGSGTTFLIRNDSGPLVNGKVAFGPIQLERCAPNQTLPSEYVSHGVLTTPFHGYFADGVKYFTTDRNGDDIPEAARLGFLSEEASTNLLVRSEEFGTTWATGGTAVITSDNHVSPSGIQNADRYVPNSGVAGILQQTVSIAIGTFAFSCYVKPTGTTLNSIRLQTTEGANFAFADFNLSTGATAVGSSGMTNVSATITNADSNGWRRCTLLFTSITAAATNFLLTQPTAAGNAVDGFYLWGAQLEQRSYLTSYVPTTGATVTRGGDIMDLSLGSWFSSSQGTWLVDGVRRAISSRMILEGAGAAVTIRGCTISTTSTATGMRILQRHGSVRDDQEKVVGANIEVKTALGWDSTSVLGAVNGEATGSTAAPGQADYSTHVLIGRRGVVGSLSPNTAWDSTIKSVSYFNYKLPATVLALITT